MNFVGVDIHLALRGAALHAQQAGRGESRGKGGEAGVVEARGRGGLMSHLQELVPYSVNT